MVTVIGVCVVFMGKVGTFGLVAMRKRIYPAENT